MKGGRPPSDLREVVDGIYFVLKTGIAWKEMPPCFASSSTCHRYFQSWQQKGVFELLWAECIFRYDDEFGLDWKKLAIDSSQTKSPLGGEKNQSIEGK
jgi:transposase